MLTLTQNATLIVKEIADQQGGVEGTGLRITAGVDEPGLTVTTELDYVHQGDFDPTVATWTGMRDDNAFGGIIRIDRSF